MLKLASESAMLRRSDGRWQSGSPLRKRDKRVRERLTSRFTLAGRTSLFENMAGRSSRLPALSLPFQMEPAAAKDCKEIDSASLRCYSKTICTLFLFA